MKRFNVLANISLVATIKYALKEGEIAAAKQLAAKITKENAAEVLASAIHFSQFDIARNIYARFRPFLVEDDEIFIEYSLSEARRICMMYAIMQKQAA